MTATAEQVTVIIGEAAVIARCYAVLARARERAWATGGGCVVFAMAVLRQALKDYARTVCGPHASSGDVAVTVLCAETAAEHLITIIRRDCGDDEAAHVAEGDE